MDSFKDCCENNVSVAFFAIVTNTPDGSTKITLKPHHEDFLWSPARTGEEIAQLTAAAEMLQSTVDATRIASLPEFVPTEHADYLSLEAKLTACRLLRSVIRSNEDFPGAEAGHLSQLNHVRIIEPAAGATVLTTQTERKAFPFIIAQEYNGQVELRMQENGPLEFSGFSTREQFCEEVLSSGLNFLALASIRVFVRKTKKAGEAKAGHDGAPEHAISAVVMEAT